MLTVIVGYIVVIVGCVITQQPQSELKKKNLIIDNIRELDKELYTNLSILYTKLMVHALLLLAYLK